MFTNGHILFSRVGFTPPRKKRKPKIEPNPDREGEGDEPQKKKTKKPEDRSDKPGRPS